MFVLLSEGRSWPGGYRQGRFNIQITDLSLANVESFLARGLLVDRGERQAVVAWGADGPGVQPNVIGINFALVAHHSTDFRLHVQRYLAEGVATGAIRPLTIGELVDADGIQEVAGKIYSSANSYPRLRTNQFSTVLTT